MEKKFHGKKIGKKNFQKISEKKFSAEKKFHQKNHPQPYGYNKQTKIKKKKKRQKRGLNASHILLTYIIPILSSSVSTYGMGEEAVEVFNFYYSDI